MESILLHLPHLLECQALIEELRYDGVSALTVSEVGMIIWAYKLGLAVYILLQPVVI